MALPPSAKQAGWQFGTLPGAESYPPLPYPLGWPGWPNELPPAFSLPDPMTAPAGKCSSCRFKAPLSAIGHCGRCEGEHLHAAAGRALTGVVGVSDEGEFLREGDEP